MKSMQRMWLLGLLGTMLACGAVSALGTEQFGNQPLGDSNYTEWPGIMPVVNHPSRVYQQWVNGNEFFYYSGDMAALNDTLQKFAAAQTKPLEVVLRPAPGVARTFAADRTIPYKWQLHLIGGIAKFLPTRDRGQDVWPDRPVLTLYVGDGVDLQKLNIPDGLKVNSFVDVKLRTRGGFQSTDKTIRGWTAGELAALDVYDEGSRDTIAAMLQDPDNWVRLNAVHALAPFGKKAAPLIPVLRQALITEDKALKTAIEATLAQIEKAEPRDAEERRHKAVTEQIRQFVSALPK